MRQGTRSRSQHTHQQPIRNASGCFGLGASGWSLQEEPSSGSSRPNKLATRRSTLVTMEHTVSSLTQATGALPWQAARHRPLTAQELLIPDSGSAAHKLYGLGQSACPLWAWVSASVKQ